MKSERECDALLFDPALETPPPEPSPPPPKKKVFRKKIVFPPRFPLIDLDTYNSWMSHRKEVLKMTHFVDDRPPGLFPELYLKPRRLDTYAKQVELNMVINKDLLRRITAIQRAGGWVDCWHRTLPPNENMNAMLCVERQRRLDTIHKHNIHLHKRLINARSDMLLTKEMDEDWAETKKKLILGASLPFVLFDIIQLDRGIKDPNFEKPPGVYRDRVSMEIYVDSGAKIGRVFIELFTDIVPKTCAMFLSLVKGTPAGHAYKGTSIFRIVPELYCRCGDVTKNNGFGCYVAEGQELAMRPENFQLKHTVPGTLSMAVTPDNEVVGQFNILFKPLPQLDQKNVVFGRIYSGPVEALERISVLGLPLGAPTNNIYISSCGWFTRRGRYKEGRSSSTRFPPGRARSSNK